MLRRMANRLFGLLDGWRQDLRSAVRSLRRYPMAALVAIFSLAAGIGATSATLTVRNVVFRKPPAAYKQPEQLSRVQVGRPDNPIRPIGNAVPAGLYGIWEASLGADLAGSAPQLAREVRTGDRTETVATRPVTPNLFAVLGADPLIGRSPGPAADSSTDAVLSYRAWQFLFDGRADAIGRTVWIDNEPYTVAAVMPERFWYADTNAPIWTLLDWRRLSPEDSLDVVVRRPPGMTPAMLDARLRPGLAEYATRLPAEQRHLLLAVSGIEGTPLARQVALVLPYVLGVAVLLTLLIACANVAVLMIAQWTAREHEIAIRASIGASRSRIIRLLLMESIVMALAGGVLGLACAEALRIWVASSATESAYLDLSLDYGVLLATMVVALLTGVVAGVAPALYETRRLHANPLRAIAGSDRVRQRWRHALVVFEIAVTVALLVVTTTMINGYLRARRGAMGFETRPLLSASVDNRAGVSAERMLETLRSLPGVEAAAAATAMPFRAVGTREPVAPGPGMSTTIVAERVAISPSFFETLGVPLRAGRNFAEGEPSATRTTVINETLGKRLFPDRSPIGASIWIRDAPYDVVGVVADYSNNPMRDAETSPRVFVPLPPEMPPGLAFLVRSRDPAVLVQPVRSALRDAAAGNVVSGVGTYDGVIRVIGQEMIVGTAPLLPLIAIGLLLTMAGIYGVLAFAVARRARELAIRVAIGATQQDLARLVTMHTVKLVGAGAGLGLALMFALANVVRAGGGAGSVFDPSLSAFVAPALVVVAVAAAATWLPARRASSIDPAMLLRVQ